MARENLFLMTDILFDKERERFMMEYSDVRIKDHSSSSDSEDSGTHHSSSFQCLSRAERMC